MTDVTPMRRALAPAPRAERQCRLVEWRPIDNNPSLAGRCTITFSGGWTVSAIPIFWRKDGALSPGVPSTPILAADGTHARDDAGKKRYLAVITFENKEARARWDGAVLGALAAAGITGGVP